MVRLRATSFVGRRRELEAIDQLLGAAPLVTLLGPPGIGKTRLAERCVELRGGRAACFCNLTEAASLDEICAIVGRALDVPLRRGDSVASVAELGEAMAARGPLLLVLDDFDDVVGHAGATIGRWILAAPEARLLVTSRERLQITGEMVFDVPPLSLPEPGGDPAASEAVQLFADRVRAVAGGYALTPDEAPRAAAVVRALDGNALAIELAAARARVCTTAELLESLPRGFDAFAPNAVDAPRHHLTLRDAVAWSWSKLTPWEQAALAGCAIFAGGFDAPAAEEILDGPARPGAPPVLDVLGALRDKSLLGRHVHPEDPTRARFRLCAGVRELASEKLAASGGAEEAAARHARHYLREARGWTAVAGTRAGADARRRLLVESDNLVAIHRRALGRATIDPGDVARAVEAALAVDAALASRAPLLVVGLLDAALAAPGAAGIAPALQGRALLARGRIRRLSGEIDACRADARAALAIAEGAGDLRLVGESLVLVAITHVYGFEISEAERCLSRALAIDVPEVRVLALAYLGEARRRDLRAAEARAAFEEARATNRGVGDLRAEASIRGNLAQLDVDRAAPASAARHVAAAGEAFRLLGDRVGEAVTLAIAGQVEHVRGRLDAAAALYQRARLALREIGGGRNEAHCCYYLALIHEAEGRRAEARALLAQVLERLGGLRHPTEGDALGVLAVMDADEDRVGDARAHLDAAERSERSRGVLEIQRGHLDLALARAARASGDGAEAGARLAAARACLAGAAPAERGAAEVRFAAQRLADAIARHGGESDAPAGAAAFVIHAGGRWFQAAGGERVEVPGKLSRILEALAGQRARAPGVPLPVAAVIGHGWPDEKMSAEAGAHRIYTAVWNLRRLGLRGSILRADGGYLLDPEVPIEIAPRGAGRN